MSSIVQHEKVPGLSVAKFFSMSDAPCGARREAIDCARAGERARQERSLFLSALMYRGKARLGACIRAIAQSKRPPAPTAPSKGTHTAVSGSIYHILPLIAFALTLGATSVGRADPNNDATDALMTGIIGWLSTNFPLPAISEHPRLELVSPGKMAEVRYRRLIGAGPSQTALAASQTMPSDVGQDLAGLYDDAHKTIYLPEGWSSATPAQVSVLVHEMVHHLQNLAGLKYECPQAREKPAYVAQDRWLGLSGLSLESEFGMDGMTMLVRTRCLG